MKQNDLLAKVVFADRETATKVYNELRDNMPIELLQKLEVVLREEPICELKSY